MTLPRLLKKLSYFSLITSFLFLSALTTHGQEIEIAPGEGSGTSDTVGTLQITREEGIGVASVSTLISAIFNIAILVAIIFVFFMLILGGYGWITAGGDKAKVEEARTRITNALIGLAIVAAAWALIVVIGQFFGVDINSINIPNASVDNSSGAL